MELEKSTLQDLKQIGRKNQTYDQLIAQRIKCNGAGCTHNGILEVKVQADNYFDLTVFLCPKCTGRFTK